MLFGELSSNFGHRTTMYPRNSSKPFIWPLNSCKNTQMYLDRCTLRSIKKKRQRFFKTSWNFWQTGPLTNLETCPIALFPPWNHDIDAKTISPRWILRELWLFLSNGSYFYLKFWSHLEFFNIHVGLLATDYHVNLSQCTCLPLKTWWRPHNYLFQVDILWTRTILKL